MEDFGLGIRFPRLDADLYVPSLLNGILGSRRWMAARKARAATAGPERRTREAAPGE